MKQKYNQEGFTFIEILVVLAIMASILALGLLVSFDMAKFYAGLSEKDTLISLLENARSKSQNNINQTRNEEHVVADPLRYILFECKSEKPQCNSFADAIATAEIVPQYEVSLEKTSVDILFSQLSGDCVPSPDFACKENEPFIIKEAEKVYEIIINEEGRIDWQ